MLGAIALAAQAHGRVDGLQGVLCPLGHQEADFGGTPGHQMVPGIFHGEVSLAFAPRGKGT